MVLRLVVAISKRNADDSTSEGIGSVLLTSRLVAWGQSNLSLIESWGKDVVPFLLLEGVTTEKQNAINKLAMRDVARVPTIRWIYLIEKAD